jgi:hypothetical protein
MSRGIGDEERGTRRGKFDTPPDFSDSIGTNGDLADRGSLVTPAGQESVEGLREPCAPSVHRACERLAQVHWPRTSKEHFGG